MTLALAGAPAGVPADATNLAVRAAADFLAAAGLARAVRIFLTKSIPAAAGLGGGSSDAGAVLRALAASFPDALEEPALARLALRLGADVPYFLAPCPARVGGIGERIQPLADFAPLACLLVNPGVPLSTAAVFAAFDATPGEPPPAHAEPPVTSTFALSPSSFICWSILAVLGASSVMITLSTPAALNLVSWG